MILFENPKATRVDLAFISPIYNLKAVFWLARAIY